MAISIEPYLEPAPHAARFALSRSLVPEPDEVLRLDVPHAQVGVWQKPGAADFTDDEVLQDPLTLLREMGAHGILDDLVLTVSAARASRRSNGCAKGRRRLPGNPVVLYLAYVDVKCTSVQQFYQQEMSRFLGVADYRGRRPALSELEADFVTLEEDGWEALRLIRNLLISSAARSEPRLLGTGWVDGTKVESGAHLQHACSGYCGRGEAHIRSSDPRDVAEAKSKEVAHPDWGTPEFDRRVPETRQPYVEVIRVGNKTWR